MVKQVVLLLLIVSVFCGCTRDDICPEDTPTTPLLVIQFYDFSNQEENKAVPGLRILDADDETISLFATTTSADSLAIPLRNFTNATSLSFILNGDSDDLGEFNSDQFNLNYTTRDVYLNRACGFVTNYDDLTGQIINESGGNWIISFEVLTTTVENQDETHIAIFH